MSLQMIAAPSARMSAFSSAPIRRTIRQRLPVVVRAQQAPQTPEPTPTPAPTPVVAAPTNVSFADAMAFSGPVPETVNGRLAMLGFFSALGAELATGQTVSQQIADAPIPILLAFLAFAAASFIPILKGADLKEALGPFTPAAELVNGRAAMIGLVALFAVEYFKGAALF